MAAVLISFFARGSSPTGEPSLLREDDFYVLREDGGRVLLESAVSGDAVIREDGGYVLREDGSVILLEGIASPSLVLDTTGATVLDTNGFTISGV